MKRLAWATDIHLNFLTDAQIAAFCRTVSAGEPDVLLIAGDISEAPSLENHLRILAGHLRIPIYFVLGNHDFYRSSIGEVRANARALGEGSDLHWLPSSGVVPLTESTALVGHDSWGDGRLGNARRSPIVLNDFLLIEDLYAKGMDGLLARLAALGDEAADHFERCLPQALATHRHVVLLAHVPPFPEACLHEGKIAGDDWLPFFTCHAVGRVLLRIMGEHPDRTMTVLCGHTHTPAVVKMLSNLEIRTGGAEYGSPQLQEVIVVE